VPFTLIPHALVILPATSEVKLDPYMCTALMGVRHPEDEEEVDRQRVRVVGGVLRRMNAVVCDEGLEPVAEGCRRSGWGSIELVEHPLMETGRGEEEVVVGELLEFRQGVQVIY
jgi:hypothetical protein